MEIKMPRFLWNSTAHTYNNIGAVFSLCNAGTCVCVCLEHSWCPETSTHTHAYALENKTCQISPKIIHHRTRSSRKSKSETFCMPATVGHPYHIWPVRAFYRQQLLYFFSVTLTDRERERENGRQKKIHIAMKKCNVLSTAHSSESVIDIFSPGLDQFPLVNFSPYFFLPRLFSPYSRKPSDGTALEMGYFSGLLCRRDY